MKSNVVSMKLSRYYEIIRPEYVYYRVIPLKSLRNYSSDKIIDIVTALYRKLTKIALRESKKIFFYVPIKISYYIYIEKESAEFYFILPKEYERLFYDKISDTWKGVTCERVNEIPFFTKDCQAYALDYLKNDALSLVTDKRDNFLLSSMLSTMSILEEGDRAGVFFNFMPMDQKYWRKDAEFAINRFNSGYPVDKQITNKKYILKIAALVLFSVCDSVFRAINEFMGTNTPTDPVQLNDFELSPESKKKKLSRVVATQIVVMSESKDKKIARNNATSLCESFKILSADNELVERKINMNFSLTDPKIKNAPVLKSTPLECQSYVCLPGKEIIEEHGIKCIDVFETSVPKELQEGVVCLGTSLKRGQEQKAFLSNDIELRNLSTCIIGSNRSGKTTFISNINYDCLSAGECNIIMDFCGNCELSDHLKGIFPGKTLIVDFADKDNMQGMGYNEIDPNITDPFEQYRNAKMQAIQLQTLINAVNDDDRSLKARMDRYLEAAALITFISFGRINDVFAVLQNHVTRAEFISRVPSSQKHNLKEYIEYLYELDETDKNGNVIGTKFNYIVGIIDRLSTLKKNTYIEMMLKKDCSNNFNLLNEIQKSQIICIKIPEDKFPTSAEKDIITTYWFTKIWLTLQIRKNLIPRPQHVKVNMFFDELYQVEKCQAIIASKLSQMPKFTGKCFCTAHYLDQIPVFASELKASHSSYIVIQGSNVTNFNYLKAEFTNLGFKQEDLLNLKRYQALCLVSYEGGSGYWAGITTLPPPKKSFIT